MNETEQWQPIPGYEGRYEASDLGRIRSTGFYCGNRWGTRTWRAGRVRRLTPAESGHLTVDLVDDDGVVKTFKVHRLVLLSFVGEPPRGQQFGLHENDVPWDNRLANLRWGSGSENGYDAVRNGGHTQSRKTACPLGHGLRAPNLVPSSTKQGGRGCLACKRTQTARHNDMLDANRGRIRQRYNRGSGGFIRRAGETFKQEADRRYELIMGATPDRSASSRPA